MRRETLAIPSLVRTQLSDATDRIGTVAAHLQLCNPSLMVTAARGSSDNAAMYFKYICEMIMGIPVASVGPSIASVYGRKLSLSGSACLSISQSGRSPDLVAFQRMAGESGALTLALVNTMDSPLAGGAESVIPIGAGEEKAVAATKSFVCSLTALVALVSEWSGNSLLRLALEGLPASLEDAITCNWSNHVDRFGGGQSVYVIGRGPMLAISQEAALKFKETCQLHAESYSSAEVLHGPIQLAASGLTALVFLSRDETRKGTCEAIVRMADAGIDVLVSDPEMAEPVVSPNVTYLPCARAASPFLDPICQIVSFYVFAELLAARLGLNPDAPLLLNKVTETT